MELCNIRTVVPSVTIGPWPVRSKLSLKMSKKGPFAIESFEDLQHTQSLAVVPPLSLCH